MNDLPPPQEKMSFYIETVGVIPAIITVKEQKGATALDEKQIAEAVAYVEDNLHEDLCLESIADKLIYSKFHINRVFRSCHGLYHI